MSEHTAGPWIAAERDAPERAVACMPRISIGQPDGSGGPGLEQCVGWIIPDLFGGPREHHAANARLMALAPEMLDALRRARDLMRDMRGGAGDDAQRSPRAHELEALDALIARAEGRNE